MYDDFFWSATAMALRFSENVAFATVDEPYAIFDSGSSHVLVPNGLYKQIITHITNAA